jgi:hypothetical protein
MYIGKINFIESKRCDLKLCYCTRITKETAEVQTGTAAIKLAGRKIKI